MDLAVVFASLVLAQLIITMGLLGLIGARAWIRRASDAKDEATLTDADQRHDVLGHLGSDPHRRQSAAASDASGVRLETSHAWHGRDTKAPRSVEDPVMALTALPISRPQSDTRGFRRRTSIAWPERLVTTPPLVSLPVPSLAGLPIRRPVPEGWFAKPKRGNRAALRRAVRRAVSAHCPACQENRALGRDYCVDCTRRLTPFLV